MERPSKRDRPSSLYRLALPGLLWRLATDRATGVLSLDDGTGVPPVQIHVLEGRITYATPIAPGDGLGPVLLRAGLITGDQYARILRRLTDELVEQEEVALAASLVEGGYVSLDEVEGALHHAIRSRVLALFGKNGVRASFRAGDAEGLGGRFVLDPATVLLEGVTTHFDEGRLDEALIPVAVQYVTVRAGNEAVARLGLEPCLAELVSGLDGRRTGDVAFGTCPLGRRAGLALAYVLHVIGALELDPIPAKVAAAPRPRAKTLPLPAPPEGRSESDVLAAYRPAPGTNHYTTLGLRGDATQRQVELAFRALAQNHRPEQAATRTPLQRKRAASVWASLVYAYETLRDPRRRQAYDALGAASPRAVELSADDLFRQGLDLLADDRALEAASCFGQAWCMSPRRADLACHEVWALMHHAWAAGEDRDATSRDGLGHMQELVRIHGESARALHVIGLAHLALGEPEAARSALAAAVARDPRLEEARVLLDGMGGDDGVPSSPMRFPSGSAKHAAVTVVERPALAASRKPRSSHQTIPARPGVRPRNRPRSM